MSQGDGKYSWRKTADNTWETAPQRSGQHVGTILYDDVEDEYILTIDPDGYEQNFTTLANAKNAFRKFLFTK